MERGLYDPRLFREAKIQEELDYRRSGSSIRNSLSLSSAKSLSVEEEDELEGRSGDAGSAHRLSDTAVTAWSDELRPGRLSIGSQSGALEAGEKDVGYGEAVTLPAIVSPPSTKQRAVVSDKLCGTLEFVSVLAHLTTFGIIGVLIRYGMGLLFKPPLAGVTSNNSPLFSDLPSNMLGSFFMGWVGVVFKKDIAMFSDHLAIGLSTGLMGSITTYAAMILWMMVNMVENRWPIGIVGLLIGMELSQVSLTVGVDSAKLLNKIIEHVNHERACKGLEKLRTPAPDNLRRRQASLLFFTLVGGGLWIGSGILTVFDNNSTSRRTLWLACLVAPPGVWTRWYFARLNGQGIGPKHHLRWLPVGTFLVNVTASSIEAALQCVEVVVGNYNSRLLVGGLNLGFLGCMSTVSTFVAEIQIMHQGKNRWRAYVYPIVTIISSLVIGFLVYGVPVWVEDFGERLRPLET